MKILSGDFAAEYNAALNDLKQEQKALDEKYEKIIKKLVDREEARLEDNPTIIGEPFRVGDKVTTVDGTSGVVESLNVILDPVRAPDFDYTDVEAFGPAKYLPLEDERDEYIFASHEILYRYDVKVEASELEKDWGRESSTQTFFPDELSIKEDE